jgi:hypothetical protein
VVAGVGVELAGADSPLVPVGVEAAATPVQPAPSAITAPKAANGARRLRLPWLTAVKGSRELGGRCRSVEFREYDLLVQHVFENLPGHELVKRGLDDLADGRETAEALLVAMAAPRLRRIGFDVPESNLKRPSHRLYELLSDAYADGYSRYNALTARMVSFARAAEHAAQS